MKDSFDELMARDWLDEVVADRAKDEPEIAVEWAKHKRQMAMARARREAGLTQAQVAERMGVKQPRVAEIERNPASVSLGVMERYAKAIGKRIVFEDAAPYEGEPTLPKPRTGQ